MIKNKLNFQVYLYILTALFFILVSGATYAYFLGDNNIDAQANLSAKTGEKYSFTSTSATNFTMNLTTADMSQAKVGNFVSSSIGSVDVTLTSPSDLTTVCTYDLLFTWTSSDKYLTPDVDLPYTNDGTTYNYEFSTIITDSSTGEVDFAERDLSKVNEGNGFSQTDNVYSGTIAEGLSITATDGTESKTHNIEARIYNLPVNQTKLINKKFTADIKVANVDCQYEKEEDIDVSTLNYLSTNSGNTIFNLVSKQGVNTTNVDSVYFVDTSKTKPGNAENIAYFKGTDNNIIKAWTNGNNLYIGSKGTVYPGPSMSRAFYEAENLNVIDMNNANMSNVVNMAKMFSDTGSNSTNFTLNLGNYFDTSNVTDMSNMFQYAGRKSTNFTLDLGNNFNTSKVTNMSQMFFSTGRNSTIFTLNLGNQFDISNVTNMSGMLSSICFSSANFTLNLGNHFNTSNVIDMSSMFFYTGYNSLNFTLNLGDHFNTSKVKNMVGMFADAGENSPNFTLDLGNHFNTSNVINMSDMFTAAGKNSTNFTLNLGNHFNTSNVRYMSSMFWNTGRNSANFTLDLGNQFNISNVTNMYRMFANIGRSSSWTLNLKSFDFSNVSMYDSFFTNRSSSNVLTVLCSPENGDFIYARVSGFTGYNVLCS